MAMYPYPNTPEQRFKEENDDKEQSDVLRPLGPTTVSNVRPATTTTAAADDSRDTSMMYSEDDDSLSDAYFFPQSQHDRGWEEGKRSCLWSTTVPVEAAAAAAAVTETSRNIIMATEHSDLLPPSRRRHRPPRMIPRDVMWALLFVLHLLALLVCAIRFGKLVLFTGEPHNTIKTMNSLANAGPTIIIHDTPVVDMIFVLGKSVRKVTALSTGFAVVAAFLVCSFLVLLDIAMIYIMLGLSNLIGLACVILGLSLEPYGGAAIAGFLLFGITLSYTVLSWNRVEFATVQLHTTVSALRPDMATVSCVAMLVLLGMILLWEWASIGIIDSLDVVVCEKAESTSCSLHMKAWHVPIVLFMLFSLMWIIFVVLNTVSVIVAGLTATWWFAPQYVPYGTCGMDITSRSVARALSVSFGSICLGSLVVGVPALWLDRVFSACCCFCPSIATKNGMILPASRSDSSGLLTAMTDEMETSSAWQGVKRLCLGFRWYCSSWNKYAFCFVGMYGFGLTDSGSRVVRLFRSRRWLPLSKDSLLPYSLCWAAIAVGICTGLFAVLMEQTEESSASSLPVVLNFAIGLAVGFVVSAILFFGVISSAVNTVLTCFAVSPTDLDKNHPFLGRAMTEAWSRRVWEH